MKCTSYCAVVMLCFGMVITACATTKIAPNAVTLNVEYTWKPSHNCSYESPAIKVSGIPDSTKELEVTLIDLDVPTFNHGGGTVLYKASKEPFAIPKGALKQYTGPCPPSGQHRYSIEVNAIDQKGMIVGSGEKTEPCCP